MRLRIAPALIGAFALAVPMTAVAVGANATESRQTSKVAPDTAQTAVPTVPIGAQLMSDVGPLHVSNVRDLSRGSCKYWAMSSHKWALTWKSAGGCTGHGWVKYKTTGGYESPWYHHANHEFRFTGSTMRWTKHKTCDGCNVTTINH
ncbi:hypothetical protein [Streptomyces synnematoformans]|uniref:Uncharacterized protein n=1 Tax=Streptomyces synnematoformans TaxID=415721 RepID=A0ABN2XSL8_9ACTN